MQTQNTQQASTQQCAVRATLPYALSSTVSIVAARMLDKANWSWEMTCVGPDEATVLQAYSATPELCNIAVMLFGDDAVTFDCQDVMSITKQNNAYIVVLG